MPCHEVVEAGHAPGYDGVVNHYYLMRAERFAPRGLLADDELAAENVTGFAWWPITDVLSYDGPDLFSPRRLGVHLSELLREGPPPKPRELGTHD